MCLLFKIVLQNFLFAFNFQFSRSETAVAIPAFGDGQLGKNGYDYAKLLEPNVSIGEAKIKCPLTWPPDCLGWQVQVETNTLKLEFE